MKPAALTTRGEETVQLATRGPRWLRREARMASIRTGTTLMDFVTSALREKLDEERRQVAEQLWVPMDDAC
jgi:hypothetical protein